MTTQELQEHLNKLVYDIEGTRLVIEADQRFIKHLTTYAYCVDVQPFVQRVRSYMEKEHRTIARHVATIEAWSQLITKDTDRQLFIDHYINGLTWLELEDKYHYASSSIFRVNKKCCEQIAHRLSKRVTITTPDIV